MEFSLLRTPASGDLLPVRLAPLLAKWTSPFAKLRGQELCLALEMSLDDDACAGFVLDFAGQGARIEVTTHGASEALLAWAFGELARATKAELVGVEGEASAALAYLEAYEEDVRKTRGTELDGNALVAWLVREDLIDVKEGATFDELPLGDPTRCYEELLEHDAVEDIFVSERELARLLSRFRAR